MSLEKLTGRILILFCCLISPGSIFATEIKVLLYNGQKIQGELIEETGEYITVLNELGQIKTRRTSIESIQYIQGLEGLSEQRRADSLSTGPLNDLVIIHLFNGETTSGFLISKSLESILLKTEWGRLTIPKRQVKRVEYINTEYAERGEFVIANLISGEKLTGYIFHEDNKTITIVTEVGRLTVEKTKVRSLEYRTQASLPKTIKDMPSGLAVHAANMLRTQDLDSREDAFVLGYSSSFGDTYSRGISLGYRNRYLIKEYASLSLHAEAGISMSLFTLNKDYFKQVNIPGSVTVEGAALISTLSLGLPFHLFSDKNSPYRFILRPAFETHLVYSSLQKSYPSFPSLDSDLRATDLRYGLGTLLGLEWTLSQNWKIGMGLNMHFLAGDDDYNVYFLKIGTRLY